MIEATSLTRENMPSQPSEKAAISADFETFLRLLTTQLRNQDPLNPMESTEFATQLATFSGVEQQVQTNALLKQMAGAATTSTFAQLADWIGLEARHSGAAWFAGQPISLEGAVAAQADRAWLVVTDANGGLVQRQEIEARSGPFTWAGVAPDGSPLGAGAYRFEIESTKGEEVIGTTPASHYAKILEARLDANGGVELAFLGGAIATAEAVSALRRP